MHYMNFMPVFSSDNLERNTELKMLLHLMSIDRKALFWISCKNSVLGKCTWLSWNVWCHILKITKLQPHRNYCNVISIGLFATRFKVVHLALHITMKLCEFPAQRTSMAPHCLLSDRNSLVRHSSPHAIHPSPKHSMSES